MQNSKVSIIVPAFNSEKTIERCLDSIFGQTLKDIEVIVINDGSFDKTGQILNEYQKKEKNLKVITQDNHGQGYSRNIAIKQSISEFIGFVDSDDTIEPQMYKDMLDKIGECDLCQCNITNVFENASSTIQLPNYNGYVEISDRHKYFRDYYFKLIQSYEACNKLFRKSFLIDNDINFANNREFYSEDLYFSILVAKNVNKIYFIEKPYYNYFQSNISHSKRITGLDIEKNCNIFASVWEDEYKYELSYLAVLILMIMTCNHMEAATLILNRDDVKCYIKNTLLYDKRIHLQIILKIILYAPMFIKKAVIKLYYGGTLLKIKVFIKNLLGNNP